MGFVCRRGAGDAWTEAQRSTRPAQHPPLSLSSNPISSNPSNLIKIPSSFYLSTGLCPLLKCPVGTGNLVLAVKKPMQTDAKSPTDVRFSNLSCLSFSKSNSYPSFLTSLLFLLCSA